VVDMTDNANHVVETHGLGKRYGERIVAVDGLDLKVRRGEVYGFLAARSSSAPGQGRRRASAGSAR